MTILDNEDLPTLQREVQRLLGRCMLRLQQYERLIKAMVAHHRFSGPIHDLERSRVAQIDDTARKTLGTLVGDLLGSYVIADEIDPPEEKTTNSPENVNWFAMQMALVLSDAEFIRVESELRSMVLLRNNLVHHFIDQHDLWSSDGCRGAQDALVTAYSCIDRNFGQLRKWAEGMAEMRQVFSKLLQSEEFRDVFVNGIAPDGKVNWDASGIVSALRQAFGALVVDGWAPVAEAGKWIAKRYPEQLPAKYGCHSWRQVVHEAPVLELRHLEIGGQRTACYRVKESTANSR
ncbi:OST-HTH/LOTUS domain-containing protein [Ruegeria faecimaris]|uniref:OST-HTH/LOTUS domain-containing protein n=1 Tax=Ruegeria faecimaris TaxID=686389 RepID=UPI00232E0B54|nr:OST-HTH/LOTUS domain-containing protein [Ruegeria faecimaris]